MEEIQINSDVYKQIKDFNHEELTKEQKLLIDKLISNEELKKSYKSYGLCKDCEQPNTGNNFGHGWWCQPCNARRFQRNFSPNWSGNDDVDKFIQNAQINAKNVKQVIEWIDYEKIKIIKYLAKGGFGSVSKATWKKGYIQYWGYKDKKPQWNRYGEHLVALKCLDNSQDITTEFLREVQSHLIASSEAGSKVIRCYGFTRDPKTLNFMMVMEYAGNGSLRQYLNNNFNSMSFSDKLSILSKIALGLKNIHDRGILHHNLHSGNILNKYDDVGGICITDLRLCQPANSSSQSNYKKVFGVLPYVAPEVLRGKEYYTSASDIYSFGIIAHEVFTGLPPHYNIAHDESLTTKICQGLRPTSDYKIPQLILDVITRCWDTGTLKRPKAEELCRLFDSILYGPYGEGSQRELFKKQADEAEEINKKLFPSALPTDILSYEIHSEAVYTSRILEFKNLPNLKSAESAIKNIQIDE